MATKKAVKQAQVIARVEFKCDHRKVVYLVRSSNGVDQHETTLFDGKATSCTCKAKGRCYHMKGAEDLESKRSEIAAQFAAKSTPAWMLNLVNTGKLVAPKVVKSDESSTIQPIGSAKDLSTKGNLNGAPTSAKTPAWLAILPSRQALAS